MNEKRYKNKIEFKDKIILKQSEQINALKLRIEHLELECKEKDELINSISPLKDELSKNIASVKKHKEEYGELIQELRYMKKVFDQELYKGRWGLVKLLIK